MLSNSLPSSYRLEKDNIQQTEWNSLLFSVDDSNLMHCWRYGEAMKEVGHKIERHVIYYNDQPIGFLQVFKRRLLCFTIVNIDRGPLFLSADYREQHKLDVLRIIRKQWSIWKGQSLIISPELILSPENQENLLAIGFRPLGPRWRSAVIDLTSSQKSLLSNLDQKWRNQLNKSIKHRLKLKITTELDDFNWLIHQYKHFKNEKNFSGASINLLTALYNQKKQDGSFQIFIAEHESTPIAGVIIATHGVSSSYLLGWNGDVGRKLYAHNFLLWEALKFLKAHKIRNFDLGGIFNKQYPGISHFKNGLNGDYYQLVGKYF